MTDFKWVCKCGNVYLSPIKVQAIQCKCGKQMKESK